MSDELFPAALRLDTEPTADDQGLLDDQINGFSMQVTGHTDFRQMTYILREQDGTLVAGIAGWTWGGGCEIKVLWVHERWRGHGIGSRLLGMMEREARAHGAGVAVLDTFDFQAPGFYPRFGYHLVGVVENYPTGHRRFTYQKPLTNE